MDLTHGRDGDVLDRSIDVLVSRLRRKLDTSGTARLFKTVRNGGYQLAVKVDLQELSVVNTLRAKLAVLIAVVIISVVSGI